MKSIETMRHFGVHSLEDINEYSAQLGWDSIYTQLKPGLFSGTYYERIGEAVITSSESISIPTCARLAGIPGFIALGILLSDTPVKINGMSLDANSFFLLMPGSDVCITTTGPVTANVALFPESELEAVLGETYIRIKKSVANVQVFRNGLAGSSERFKNWFLTWLSNPFIQIEYIQRTLSHQIYETMYAALASIGESLEKGAQVRGLKDEHRPKKTILELIDFFYYNPENLLTTADMCSFLGVSRRTLFYDFKHYTGFTPHHVFKHIRLQAVHRNLLNQTGNVTEMASRYNFHHLGEFSALYKNTYGELPSESFK